MALPLAQKQEETAVRCIAPVVSVKETDKEVVLEAEMIGLKKDDISVHVEGDELVIRGSRSSEAVPKGYDAIYRERCPYRYERRFFLEEDVDRDKINARYDKGILRLTLGKNEKNRPRKISID